MRVAAFWFLLASAACAQFDDRPQTTLVPLTAPVINETGFQGKYGSTSVWRDSPSAEYHKAAVRVKCDQTPYAGSGAVVKVEGDGMFVTTNHHVIEGTRTVTITATDGSSCKADVIWASRQFDLAVCYCPGKPRAALPIYGSPVPVGGDVELLGYGGPHQDLRHVLGKKLPQVYSYPVSIDCATVSGDSGGAMVYGGGICAVNFGAPGTPRSAIAAPGGPWSLVHPASSNVDGPKLVEVLTQICRPYGCRPIVIGQPVQPPVVQPPIVQPPVVQPPVVQPDPKPCPPGPPGKDGAAGPPGPPGPAGKDGVVDPKMVDEAVEAYLLRNADRFTISLALIDEDGNELDRDTVSSLGGVLRLQLYRRD